jgi:hypothetical protein
LALLIFLNLDYVVARSLLFSIAVILLAFTSVVRSDAGLA